MPAAILTLILSVAFAVAPWFTADFTGYRPDQLPIPQIDPPLQPAGYAFSIWLVIYGWLILSAGWGLWNRAEDRGWARVRPPLIIALALGTGWIAVANRDAISATVVILAMLAAALVALWRTPDQDRYLLRAPVALLAGWLTAASFVSLGVTAAGYGILFGSIGWAYAGQIMALAVAVTVQLRIPNAPDYSAAVVWALVAIAVRNGTDQIGVTALALIGAVALTLIAFRGAGRAGRAA